MTGRAHHYDSVADPIAERVEKVQGRISRKRLLPVARTAGYEDSARNFQRLAADVKALWRNTNHSYAGPAAFQPHTSSSPRSTSPTRDIRLRVESVSGLVHRGAQLQPDGMLGGGRNPARRDRGIENEWRM